MTQLFIDNQEVALPEDFSFDLIRENPFFTKGGSFTLDISINLDIPINARLYAHLNRFMASSVFKNRTARLIVDGRTVLNGTEIILEVNELSASIQLASGNSELNFLVGSDVKLNTLDLGSIPVINAETARNSRKGSYPAYNYICPPVKAKKGTDSIFINNIAPEKLRYLNGRLLHYYHNLGDDEIRVMPYLNYIIEKCITAIGYSIGKNSIRNSVFNRLFIVHANITDNYGDLMPDKTVADFLTEIEELLDVLFVVREDNSIDILFRYEYYASPTIFSPVMIAEQFERKYLNTDEQLSSHKTSNIIYDFEDTDINKEADIDPEIIARLNIVRCTNRDGIDGALWVMNKEAIMRSVFIDGETNQEFICKKFGEGDYDFKLWPVNTFKRISGQSGEDIELEIVPSEMENLLVTCCKLSSESDYEGYLQIPVISNYTGLIENILTAEEAIRGKEEESQSLNKITVAFAPSPSDTDYYITPVGKEGYSQYKTYSFPNITTHYNIPWSTDNYILLDKTYATMSLNSRTYGLSDRIYSKAPEINTEQEITVHAILDKIIPSPTYIFVVNGKKTVCKSIQFKITPDGFDPEYQATLYAMM